jgi:predicted transcriptional regulator
MSKGRRPVVTDSKLIQVIKASNDPAVTTKEVAQEVEIGRAGAYERLVKLADNGPVKKKEVGSRAVVWWVDN